MRYFRNISIIVLVLVFLSSCATLQQKYKALSEDEKARLHVSALQDSLSAAFDSAKAYVVAHPEKQADWKAKIIPMFDMANKVLHDIISEGNAGKPLTVLGVSKAFADKTIELRQILIGWRIKL